MKLRSSVLEDCSLLERKEAVIIQLSPHFSTISPEYVLVTDILVSTLFLNLQSRQSRMVTLKSLDLISKLASVPDNASYFQVMPDAYFDTIIDFLNVSYSFLDPYSNSRAGANATSVAPFVSESFADAADIEFRDLSLEVIAQLCANSQKIQSRLAEMKQCFRNLLIIIRNLKSEKTSLRNIDTNLTKAVQILNQVLSRTFEMATLYSLQLELCTEFGDDILSDTICTHLQFNMHGQQSSFLLQTADEYND